MPNSFTQPYFGADVSWPRLVTLFEGNGLVLDSPKVQWNTANVENATALLPRNGVLITRIDRESSRLVDSSAGLDVWTQHDRVGTVVVHGAYNHDAAHGYAVCCQMHSAHAELTKTHKVSLLPYGATVHILTEDFFRSFCRNYRVSQKALHYAFNRALTSLTGLTLPDVRTPHEEQFATGVTAPYYDLVCAHRVPELRSLTCNAYLANYAAPRSTC